VKICVIGGYAPSLVNFRGPLLQAMVSRGHSVAAVAPRCLQSDAIEKRLGAINIRFRPIPLARAGFNPVADLWSLCCLLCLLLAIKPDLVLAYTVKPVVYGGLAVRLARLLRSRRHPLRSAALITGLGYVFTAAAEPIDRKRSALQAMSKVLYREGLRASQVVFFQNPDDQQEFQGLGLVPRAAKVVRVWGSGVDLALFPPRHLGKPHVFLMVARLLADKGVREYVQAARLVQARFPDAIFQLAGSLDPNPAAISKQELAACIHEGVIHYLGEVRPVQPALEACRYYVLPSYREGTPRSVLEAMATGRPVITSDAPGCRETVINGVNGFLVPPRDPEALAEAMVRLIEQPEAETQRMAQASLDLARERYDVHKVNAHMLEAMQL